MSFLSLKDYILQDGIIESTQKYHLLLNTANDQFKASSHLGPNTQSYHSRAIGLFTGRISKSAWYAEKNEPNEWVQVDLAAPKFISEFLIGPPTDTEGVYVSKFRLFCSLDGSLFDQIGEYTGTSERVYTSIGVWLCRYVKLLVLEWQSSIGMVWELVQAASTLP